MVIFRNLQTTQDELTMIGWETRNDSRNENNNDCNQRMDRSKPKLQQRSKNTTSFNTGGQFLDNMNNSFSLRNRKKISEGTEARMFCASLFDNTQPRACISCLVAELSASTIAPGVAARHLFTRLLSAWRQNRTKHTVKYKCGAFLKRLSRGKL